MTTPKPHIVLIHGAWHTPACFSGISKTLNSLGYITHARQLASVGNSNPPKDLSEDVAVVRELVDEAINDGEGGNDVLVVSHSWSGIVSGSALGGFGKKQWEEKGLKGGVVKIAFLCAFVVPEGVSLLDALQHQVPDWWIVKVGPSHFHSQGLIYTSLRCLSFCI